MATRVLIVDTDGAIEDIIFPHKPTFKDIYPKIQAKLIEPVKGKIEIDTMKGIRKKTVEIWTDEEAKITGKPVNTEATKAYRHYWASKKQWTMDTINGAVAVLIPNYEQYEV
tara:strand:- start:1946 stop:2281 length:336 start_codon:yes stop_codon:yes gene_type:complete